MKEKKRYFRETIKSLKWVTKDKKINRERNKGKPVSGEKKN